MKKIHLVLPVLLLFCVFTSCDFEDLDPVKEEQRDAYYTVIEAHAVKQIWMYRYFELCSDGYSRGKLFIYDPEQKEIDQFWDELTEILEYEEAVENAVEVIREAQYAGSLHPDIAKLKSVSGLFDAMTGFYNWASGAGENGRKRIQTVASYMTKEQKDELFNDMLRSKWRNQFNDAEDFWQQLENGKIDDKAPQIYNDFYYYSASSDSNPFFDYAQDKGLTPAKIVVKEGAKGIEAGAAVIIETVKSATPLGKGIDILEEGKKWYEKSEKAIDNPKEFIKDEIKERITGKIDDMLDVDGFSDAVGLGEKVGETADKLIKTITHSNEPESTSQTKDDWGVVKISSPDNSLIPEVIYAERTKPNLSTEIYLGVGNKQNTQGETLMALPSGNWNVKAIDSKGESNSFNQLSVLDDDLTEVEVLIEEDEEFQNEQDQNELPDSVLNNLKKFQELRFYLFSSSASFYEASYAISNHLTNNGEYLFYPITWSGGSFSCNFEHTDNEKNSKNYITYDINMSGEFTRINDSIFLHGTANKEHIRYFARDDGDEIHYQSDVSYTMDKIYIGNLEKLMSKGTLSGGKTDYSDSGILDDFLQISYEYTNYSVNKYESYNRPSQTGRNGFYIGLFYHIEQN